MRTRALAAPSVSLVILSILLIFFRTTPAQAQRLPATVTPEHYDLTFTVDLDHARFEGTETIRVQVNEPTPRVVLNAIDLTFKDVTIAAGGGRAQQATVSLDEQSQTAMLTVPQSLAKGTAEIRIQFSGILNDKLR